MKMKSVLFVCTANRYRSVIASACFKNELKKRNLQNEWLVSSAGTWTTEGLPAMPEAIKLAKSLGLDVQSHRSREISSGLIETADLVLVMEAGQKEALLIEFPGIAGKIFMLSELSKGLLYDVPDPISGADGSAVVSDICDLIQNGFDRIFTFGG